MEPKITIDNVSGKVSIESESENRLSKSRLRIVRGIRDYRDLFIIDDALFLLQITINHSN